MPWEKLSRLVPAALAFGPLWWFAVQWLGMPVWGFRQHGLLWLAGLNTALAWLLAWRAAGYSGWGSFGRALLWGLLGGALAQLWLVKWGHFSRAQMDLSGYLLVSLFNLVCLKTLVFWALIAFSDFMAREPEQGDGSA